MASLCRDGKRWRVVFVNPEGTRKPIRLGEISEEEATRYKRHVGHLATALISGDAIPDRTARWVADLPDRMHAKLARVGLVLPRQSRDRPVALLGPFLDSFIEYRRSDTETKSSTVLVFERVRRYLVEYFEEDKPLSAITIADAKRWRSEMLKSKADNTVRRSIGIARQFMQHAIEARLIETNPFKAPGLASNVRRNEKRMHFVSRDVVERVLNACPDAQWRLMFTLARYGGLRCPSEILRLKWSDIAWDADRFTVHSPKTERHAGHDKRIVPIFPELLPYLQDAEALAEVGDVYCITRYRDTAANLRTQLTRILTKAGVEQWPKLWQNLRSSRQTELEDDGFPSHVVCQWIGNSERVARDSYLQTTEHHFERAISTKAARKTARSCGARERTDSPEQGENRDNRPEMQEIAPTDSSVQSGGMGVTGLEPVTSRV